MQHLYRISKGDKSGQLFWGYPDESGHGAQLIIDGELMFWNYEWCEECCRERRKNCEGVRRAKNEELGHLREYAAPSPEWKYARNKESNRKEWGFFALGEVNDCFVTQDGCLWHKLEVEILDYHAAWDQNKDLAWKENSAKAP